MRNRIAKFFAQASKPRPVAKIVNDTTVHDPFENLPKVYHTCGVRCLWLATPGSPHVQPHCPRCERFDLATK